MGTDVLHATVVGRFEGDRIGHVSRVTAGFVLQNHQGSSVRLVRDDFSVAWECSLPTSRGRHAVSLDGSMVAASLPTEVRLLTARGKPMATFPHPSWAVSHISGACAFDLAGHVWAAVPSERQGPSWMTPAVGPFDFDLVALDLDGLRPLASVGLDSLPQGLVPLLHPDGRTVGWSIGEGQDRLLMRWSSLHGSNIELRGPSDQDRVLTSVHADGSEYLTTPHMTGALQRHSFADDQVIQRVRPVAGTQWDFAAFYLDRDSVIAARHDSEEEALTLLSRAPLQILATIELQGSRSRWPTLAWAGQREWITVGDDVAELWRLLDG